jgi:nucleoside-diphosphate-sugar epimerase
MKILITGATGFIGSHVVRALLLEGHEIVAISRPISDRRRIRDVEHALRIVDGDVNDGETARRIAEATKPEICVHLAWFAVPGKYSQAVENLDYVQATARLAWNVARCGCRRFVGIGSCAEYDMDQGYLSESTPIRPRSLYAAAKAGTQMLLEQIGTLTGMATVWVRLFYQYGPYEADQRLVPAVIQSLLRGQVAKTTRGEQIRDFLHVEDVASAIAAITFSELTGVVNVVRTLAQLVGREDLIDLGAIPYGSGEPMFVCADNRRLKVGTGWAPAYSLTVGLQRTILWWEKHSGP